MLLRTGVMALLKHMERTVLGLKQLRAFVGKGRRCSTHSSSKPSSQTVELPTHPVSGALHLYSPLKALMSQIVCSEKRSVNRVVPQFEFLSVLRILKPSHARRNPNAIKASAAKGAFPCCYGCDLRRTLTILPESTRP